MIMAVMDKTGKKVTHVRDVRHHANCLDKIRRQYEFTFFLDSYRRIDGHDQKIRALCTLSDTLVRKV
jgi:hypothetical protein